MSEDTEEKEDKKNTSAYWLQQLNRAKFNAWETRVKGIIKRYRDDRPDSEGRRSKFNIFWSNVEVLKPIIYSRTPVAQAVSRWKNKDRVARLAAQIQERCLQYEIDTQPFDYAARCSRDDYLIAGRGVLWERVATEFDELGNLAKLQTLTDFVNWADFRHSLARTWDEVTWVARRVMLTEEEAESAFGDKIADELNYSYVPESVTRRTSGESSESCEGWAEVWEIWDKQTRRVYHISEGYHWACAVADDPLGLRDFFPCARPMYASTTTDTLEPIPDFAIYQDLAGQLDLVTQRITRLTDALKAVGIYDLSLEGLNQLITGKTDTLMVGVKNFAGIVAAGGVEGAISWFPLDKIALTLKSLMEVQEQIKYWIFEISGMSDIMRGQTDPRATAKSEQIKSSFVTIRVSDRQGEMQRFLRDQLALKGEIIAEHYPPEIKAQMVGIDLSMDPQFMEACQVLQDDYSRCYKIEIETDSTLAVDEQMEKAQRNEFLAAFGQAMQQFAATAAAMPDFVPLFGEVLLFSLRAYKVGRQIEDQVEQTLEASYQKQQQMAQQPPPPDPEQMKMQAEMEMRQGEMQLKQFELQGKGQLEGAKLQLEQQRIQMDYQKMAKELELKQQGILLELQKAQKDAELKQYELQSTLALKAEEARNILALEALKMSNTPDNEETRKTVAEVAPQASTPPLNININQPSKRITFGYDAAGNRTALAENIESEVSAE